MTIWNPISTAPKDRLIILFGPLIGQAVTEEHPKGTIRAIGYWDDIDGAWCLSTTSWVGPFIDATHWLPCPDRPSGTDTAPSMPEKSE